MNDPSPSFHVVGVVAGPALGAHGFMSFDGVASLIAGVVGFGFCNVLGTWGSLWLLVAFAWVFGMVQKPDEPDVKPPA